MNIFYENIHSFRSQGSVSGFQETNENISKIRCEHFWIFTYVILFEKFLENDVAKISPGWGSASGVEIVKSP